MEALNQRISKSLEKRESENTLRRLRTALAGVDFSSNDYLGLASNQELYQLIHQKSAEKAAANGSGGSRLISGNSLLAEELERELAEFFRAEATLMLNSGYLANLALLSSLPGKGDTILYDELAHASIKDGARLSPAQRFSFKHNQPAELEKKLQRSQGQVFVVVESVYSMDGDAAPLAELAALCKRYDAALIVDEAHSTGLYGEGRGLVCELGLEQEVFARIHTFGKAIGNHGACVAGSVELRHYLINFSRPFIYTTAPPPYSFSSLQTTFRYLQAHPELLELHKENIRFFVQLKKEYLSGLLPAELQIESQSAIQALVYPGSQEVISLAQTLWNQGYDVRPILSPTVAQGKERLRICIHVFNTKKEIKGLVETLAGALA